MRALALAGVVLLWMFSLGGAEEGASCGADLECADGLQCACGECASYDDDVPPACEVAPDNQCSDTPSSCFQACGIEVVVGLATCVAGRETCVENGGVLRDACPVGTCWGDAEPGEVCVDGVYECAFGRHPSGRCYTFDCVDEPEECVLSCQDDVTFTQICLGSEWRCDTGFPVRQCGGCVGTPPTCFDNCVDLVPDSIAECVDNDWSCDDDDLVLESECCLSDIVVDADGELTQPITDAACITGQLVITFGSGALTMPNLVFVDVLGVASTAFTSMSFPKLRDVRESLVVTSNPILTALDAPVLEHVGGSFTVSNNPSLPECGVLALAAGAVVDGTITVGANQPADGGCPIFDAGVDDAGVADGGAPDAGAIDGGVLLDGGVLVDGGAVDAGPLAEHLLLCEVRATDAAEQFIEIVNATDVVVDLTDTYLADDMDYALVAGAAGDGPAPAIAADDFIVRFPAAATIGANDVVVIALDGAGFFTKFGVDADFEILATRTETPDLLAIDVGASAALSDVGEMVALFSWDGAADVVADLDLFRSGLPGVDDDLADKATISVDGPDGDTTTSTYATDALTMPPQSVAHAGDTSTKRVLVETDEDASGGNGAGGHDETTEDIAESWDDAPYAAATPFVCGLVE